MVSAFDGMAVISKKTAAVYASTHLEIIPLTAHTYRHVSFITTHDFGNVSCNGLIVVNEGKAVVFDTPTNDSSALELIHWLQYVLKVEVAAVIPTHFHEDCLGGLQAFHAAGIPSYAHQATIDSALTRHVMVPQQGFVDSLRLPIGSRYVSIRFFGAGHTADNVVAYFKDDEVLFGGCLIKALGAGKGYLGDADVKAWPQTVNQVKAVFPSVVWVVPGHGAPGSKKLLKYTIRLFSK